MTRISIYKWIIESCFSLRSFFSLSFYLAFIYHKYMHRTTFSVHRLTCCRILRPGGIWVNLGPLLYHYSDVSGEGSIEPTYEDLLLIIRGCGFQILVIIADLFVFYCNKLIDFIEYRKMRPASKRNMHRIHDRCSRANIWVYFLCAKNRSRVKRTNIKMATMISAIWMEELQRLAINKLIINFIMI